MRKTSLISITKEILPEDKIDLQIIALNFVSNFMIFISEMHWDVTENKVK